MIKGHITILKKAIHRANQRLFQIGQSFGKDSATYKNALASIGSADFEPFVSSNDRLVSSKIIKAIQEGKNEGEIERILNLIGYKINAKGNLSKTKSGSRIQTVKELKIQYEVDYGKPEKGVNIYDEINKIQDMGNDLHELVYEIQDKLGESGGREIIDELFPEITGKRGSEKYLSHSVIEQAKRKARNILFDLKESDSGTRNAEVKRLSDYKNKTIKNGGMKNE